MSTDFTDLFDGWADEYDRTVQGTDPQYRDVFAGYEDILSEVAAQADGHVLEFGVGTGNLSKKLLERGLVVTGIEPSKKMLEQAKKKLPTLHVMKGSFLSFPSMDQVDTIVSTYAFHHLTDKEKADALKIYAGLLSPHGKIVFADTIFDSEKARARMIQDAKDRNFLRLVADLESEYYTTSHALISMGEQAGFSCSVKKANDFVKLFIAKK